MKRTLSLVLALVMLLGTIPVFAAETADEKIEFLKANELLKGNLAGELMLGEELLRQDSVVVLARLLKVEDEAIAWDNAPTWTDLPENPYYVSVLGWGQDEGYYLGLSETKFGFGDAITANDFALVLWRALGYPDPEVWTDAFDAAKELGLVEGLDLEGSDKLLRRDMALMMYAALGAELADGSMTLAEKLGVEMPVLEMTLTATGAKQLTLNFSKAVDKASATIAVTKGLVAVNVDKTEFSADNTSAVITTITNLTAGTYTVKVEVNGESFEASVTVTDVKVAAIRLVSDIAPMQGNAGTTGGALALVNYEVLNQYNEKMTGEQINWTVSTGQGLTQTTDGKLMLSTNTFFTPGQIVYLTGVHVNSGTVLNTQVTIALPSSVDTLVFTGLYNDVKDEKVATLPADFADNTYFLTFEVKDQYGNTVVPKAGDVIFTSNNPLLLTVGNFVTIKDAANKDVLAVKLTPATYVGNGGTVTVQGISIYTGKTASTTLEVPAKATLKTFTMNSPAVLVAEGEEVEIPFVALDQFNNAITKFSTLNGMVNNGLTFLFSNANGATLKFVEKTDGTAKLVYKAPSEGATANFDLPVQISSIVMNGNTSNIQFSVKDTAKAVVVVGLDKVVRNLVPGAVVEFDEENIRVQDQHGRTMLWKDYKGVASTLVLEKAVTNANNVTFTTSGSAFTVTGANTGNETLVLKLSGVSGSEFNFVMSVVSATSVATYEVKDLPLIQQGQTKTLEITGKLANGQEVAIVPAAAVKSLVSSNTSVATVSGLTVTAVANTTTSTPDATVALVFTFEGSTGPIIVTKDITVSYKAPVATTITLAKTLEVATVVGATNEQLAEAAKALFTVKDQYGNTLSGDAKGIVVVTNVPTTIEKGKTFNATLITPNGMVNTIVVTFN